MLKTSRFSFYLKTLSQKGSRSPCRRRTVGRPLYSDLLQTRKGKPLLALFLAEGDLRAAADIRDSHSRTPRNRKSTRILWNLPCVRAQSRNATKRYLAVERPQVTRVERIGPVLFCAACSCVAANHSSDISRRGLLTKWRTARSSSIQK